jgi:hypothetical protein
MATEVKSNCGRCSAIDALKDKAYQLIRRGNNLIALAKELEKISKEGMGQDFPYIGVGSVAEEALWELIVNADK